MSTITKNFHGQPPTDIENGTRFYMCNLSLPVQQNVCEGITGLIVERCQADNCIWPEDTQFIGQNSLDQWSYCKNEAIKNGETLKIQQLPDEPIECDHVVGEGEELIVDGVSQGTKYEYKDIYLGRGI